MKSPSRRERSIQLSISKKRMKLDLPEPFAPMRTVASGRSESSTDRRDLKPSMRTDSILVRVTGVGCSFIGCPLGAVDCVWPT